MLKVFNFRILPIEVQRCKREFQNREDPYTAAININYASNNMIN